MARGLDIISEAGGERLVQSGAGVTQFQPLTEKPECFSIDGGAEANVRPLIRGLRP